MRWRDRGGGKSATETVPPLTIEKIQRLDIQPGDQVVLTVGERYDQMQLRHLAESWDAKFQGNPCIILAGDVQIERVIPAEWDPTRVAATKPGADLRMRQAHGA